MTRSGRLRPLALLQLCVSVAIAAAVIGVSACLEAPSTDGASTTAASGVEVVGTSEMIGRIADVIEGEDGTIWVLNSTAPYFIAMSPDGTVLRSWGRSGGGPDEFRGPSTLLEDPATGQIYAYDSGHHALMRVDGPEDPVETLMLPRDSIPTGRVVSSENLGAMGRAWIVGTTDGYLVGVQQSAADLTGMWGARIVELSRDGEVHPAFAISDRLGDPATRYGSTATEFLPYPLFARCPDASIALYDPLSNGIIRLSPDDAVMDTIPLPPERSLEVTFDRVFRMAYGFMKEQMPGGQAPDSASMYNLLQSQWGQMENEAAGVFPEYADLQCPDGTFWMQVFDPDAGQMGRSPNWMHVSADGMTSNYRFPDRFRPLRFESSRILGVSFGEFDIESVAWMPVPGTD